MRMLPLRPARLALAGAIACCAAGSAPLVAQDSPVVIKACIQKASTQMRLVADGAACRPNEELVVWNVQGPQGPAGPQGDPGPQGLRGLPGPPGEGLATGTVRGRLVACAPGPATGVAGVSFVLVHLQGHSYTAMTDTNGEFVFHFVPPGTYHLGPPQYAAAGSVEVSAGATTVLDDLLTTNLLMDSMNCSACDVICGANSSCVNGSCQAVPPPPPACSGALPYQCPNGTCATDATMCPAPPPTCLAPGVVCPASYGVNAGRCVANETLCETACASPAITCSDGSCRNTFADCGLRCYGAFPHECPDGTCVPGPPACAPAPGTCSGATPYRCDDGTCASGATMCPAPGCTAMFPYKCADGTCTSMAMMCAPPECRSSLDCGQGQNCINHACVQTCPIGQGLCSDVCVSLDSPQNCGSCGNTCAAGFVCGARVCIPDPYQCAAGQQNCGGVCRSTGTDPTNCGGCGIVCGAPNAVASCVTGVCQFSCQPGFADCDGLIGSGCETNISSSQTNCGACGVVCGLTQVCVAGACSGGGS